MTNSLIAAFIAFGLIIISIVIDIVIRHRQQQKINDLKHFVDYLLSKEKADEL